MVLEFQNDPTCQYLDKQYMFGDSFLVAPIFNEEGMAEYFVPEGNWTNFLTGEKVVGGRWIKEHHNYLCIPCLVKENSIIAVGAVDTKPEYDYAKDVTLKVFQLIDGTEAKTDIYNMAAEVELTVSVRKEDEKITIKVQNVGVGKPYNLYLHDIKNVATAEGATISLNEQGTTIAPNTVADNSVITILCTLN